MVRVTDLDQSLDFYCNKLGLVEYHRYDSEAGRFTNVFLHAAGDPGAPETKSPVLELTYNWPAADGSTEVYTAGRNFGHLAYRVDNIYDTCQQLQDNGITINRPPRDGYMAFIKSPDGISIELLQAGEALDIVEPWQSMPNCGTW